jgi:hypothetical protein
MERLKMRRNYRAWLEGKGYGGGTVSTNVARTSRVEEHYGDLDERYRSDGLRSIIDALRYTSEDERRRRPNPSKLPIDGNLRTNLASYRNAIENYRRFLGGGDTSYGSVETDEAAPPVLLDVAEEVIEAEVAQRIGLERDMQAALRLAIGQLEPGLTIVDGGVERVVEAGRIDITARDAEEATVIIELKAGVAGQRAVAQVLSYMGDMVLEEPDVSVRGILVASGFDRKAIAAARMAPALTLKTYSVKFLFSDPNV